MKITGFFLALASVFLFIAQLSQNNFQFQFPSYDSIGEDKRKVEIYRGMFEELSWIKGDVDHCGSLRYNKKLSPLSNIYLSLKFLDAMISGEYLDYLDLYVDEKESLRLSFNEFLDLHHRLETMQSLSIFSKEEFKEILMYVLVLKEVESSEIFKERSWVYGTCSLREVAMMYQDVLPTFKKFSIEQKKFLQLLLHGFLLDGLLENYRNNMSYNEEDTAAFTRENVDNFDLVLLLFICRMAGNYSKGEKFTTHFTSGYFSYLLDFGNDVITHLQSSV